MTILIDKKTSAGIQEVLDKKSKPYIIKIAISSFG